MPLRAVASPARLAAHTRNCGLRRGRGPARFAAGIGRTQNGPTGPERARREGRRASHGRYDDRHSRRRRRRIQGLSDCAGGRQRAGPADRAGDFRDQRELARCRRPLRRGRLRLPRARSLLAHGARRGPGLRGGGLRQGLRLLRALRRGPGASRHRRGAGCAARAARVHRRGRRHGLLPRRQARLPDRVASRRRCGGLVLWRRHRGGAR